MTAKENIPDKGLGDDFIDIKILLESCWKEKLTIFLITGLFAFGSVLYAISLPNIYQSSAILTPTSSNDSLQSKLSSLSALSSLAGVNIPVEASRSQEAIERIKSYEFFVKFFLPNIKLENLMAAKKWLPEENAIQYNEKVFDDKNSQWVGNFNSKKKPSNQMAYIKYRQVVIVSADKKTPFVKISSKHVSPNVAMKWTDIIIKNINESMRNEDIELTYGYIDYLNEYLSSTKIQSLRDAISNLLEIQLQTLMIASSNEDYIFKIIDPPTAPELKLEPNRAIICIISSIVGAMLSIILVITKLFLRNY